MADTSIKLSGTYDSIEAYRILEEMRGMSEDYEDIKEEAEAASSAATAAVATANAAVTNATTAATNASTYADNANTSATAAAGSASTASTAADNALDSETAAASSASAASTSETNAAASATAAAASAAEAAATLQNYLPLSGGTLTGAVNGVTPPAGDDSKKLANTEFIQALASILVPTGCVQAFAGSATPNGWLLCDGSAVSRTDYANLFSVIGTSYGSGDGSTTFNLPDLVDKFIEGSATAGTVKSAGLPNITGAFIPRASTGFMDTSASGAFYENSYTRTAAVSTTSATNAHGINFSASRSNSIYGNSTTVQPPSVTMRYIIKY